MKKVYVPNYYDLFKCKASACEHTCCVGWEIDIDRETLSQYRSIPGKIGERLKQNIDWEAETPCFKLTADERCPFLDQNGLCELISELGEESLCSICNDHPRFRNILPDRVELGLGLCCEAAAKLILSQTEPFSVVKLPPEPTTRERHAHEDSAELDALSASLIAHREALLLLFRDRTKPLSDRIRHVFEQCDIDLAESVTDTFGSFSSITALLRDMERLDPTWDACLDALERLAEDPLSELDSETSVAYENLICYFLYRYMTTDAEYWPDAKRTRTAFAVLCTIIIHAIHRATGGKDLDSLCETARMFSSEIEYSEENLERLMSEVEDAVF